MTRSLFGTHGVRGRANVEPMTSETALRLGRACAHVFRDGGRRHRVLIGKDTRLSGYMLEPALTAGFVAMGMDVILLSPLPTPATARRQPRPSSPHLPAHVWSCHHSSATQATCSPARVSRPRQFSWTQSI